MPGIGDGLAIDIECARPVVFAVAPAAGGIFPLRFRRKVAAEPARIGQCVFMRDVNDGMIVQTRDRAPWPLRVAPVRAGDKAPAAGLAGRAEQLGAWLGSVFDDAGVAAVFPRVGGLSGVFFAETAPRNFDEAKRSDTELYGLFFHELLARGVAFAPSAYEALFPSLSHTKDDLERTADIARAALDAALRRRAANNL